MSEVEIVEVCGGSGVSLPSAAADVASEVLIACIGNIFFGDDAFGVEVADRLAGRELPPLVRVVDFGIRGFDLAYALLEPRRGTILVDALPRGGEPGTLYVLDPTLDELAETHAELEGHGMDPIAVLRLVQEMGGRIEGLTVVGCEPASYGFDATADGLSPVVAAALDEAADLIESLAIRLLHA